MACKAQNTYCLALWKEHCRLLQQTPLLLGQRCKSHRWQACDGEDRGLWALAMFRKGQGLLPEEGQTEACTRSS